jgi:hypothetical protein
MKRALVVLAAVALLVGSAGLAKADVWTSLYDPNPNIYLSSGSTIYWTFDLTDPAGFVPCCDVVWSYDIVLTLYDDANDGLEVGFFNQPGIVGDKLFVSLGDVGVGGSIEGWLLLNATGMLDVSLTSTYGDFVFDKSLLTAEGISCSVPEPATLLLLGSGLLGMVGLGRMRRK